MMTVVSGPGSGLPRKSYRYEMLDSATGRWHDIMGTTDQAIAERAAASGHAGTGHLHLRRVVTETTRVLEVTTREIRRWDATS